MKKRNQFIASLLLTTSIFSLVSMVPTYAAVKESTPTVIEYDLSDPVNLYKYGLISNYTNSSIDPNISLLRPEDPPSDAVIISGPMYKTYTHSTLNTITDLLVSGIFYKASSGIKKSSNKFLTNWVGSKLNKFLTSLTSTTYVGSWLWTSEGHKYATLVHYTDSSHSQPKDVQIIDVTDY